MHFTPHSEKQSKVLFSNKRIVILACGIQFGKTISGVVWLKTLMHQYTNPTDNFLVTAPTYKILEQATIPPFMSVNEDIGKYNKKHDVFEIDGGGKVWFRTGRDPDSVVGITNVRGVLCDEAGLYSRYFWDNIQARASFKEAPIRIVTSPYALNWLYTDFIRPANRKDPYVLEIADVVQARSDENPFFPPGEYEARRRTMNPGRFNMIYGGNFGKGMEGLVYDCFDEEMHQCDPINFPEGTRFFGGVDWGYADPSVLKVRAVTPTGMHYDIYEFYKTKQTITDLIDVARRARGLFPIEIFVCDPSRPDNISEFNAAGLPAIGAQNDILLGIDKHYELIKQERYKVFKNSSPNTINEYATYHYPLPKDLLPDQSSQKSYVLPVDKENHTQDVARYLTLYTANLDVSKKPMKLQENIAKNKETIHNVDINYQKRLKKRKNIKYNGL